MAYDPTTPAGQVRLLATDTSDVEGDQVFNDPEIDTFLLLEGGNVRRAAAMAIETIATNEALVLKVIRTLDLQTDGAKLADVLLKRAKALRDQADDDADTAEDDFAVAEFADPVFGARTYRRNQYARGL